MPQDNQNNPGTPPPEPASDRPDFSAAPPSRFHRPTQSADSGSTAPVRMNSGAADLSTPPPIASRPSDPAPAMQQPTPIASADNVSVPSAGQTFTPNQTPSDEGRILSADGFGGPATTLGRDEHIAPATALPVPPPVSTKKPWLKIAVVAIIATVVLGGVGYAAYNYMVLEPQNALGSYIGKIGRSKTAAFAATAVPKNSPKTDQKCDDSPNSGACAPPSENNWKLSTKGVYDINSLKDPKFDISGSLTVDNVSYGADARLLNKIFFFKIGDIGALGAELPLGKDWYKIKLDDEELTKEATKCLTDSNNDQVVSQALWVNFPVKNTKRLSMNEQINGKSTTHFSGEIDFAQLQKRIAEANKKLSADCKIDIQPSDYANAEVKYDLYTSANFDRIVVTFSDTKTKDSTELTLDTSDYNKPVKIEEPANAKEWSEFYNQQLDNGNFVEPIDIEGDPEGTANTLRRENARSLKRAVEQFASNHEGRFPNPNVDWFTTKPGEKPRGPFPDEVGLGGLDDGYKGEAPGYTMVTGSMPDCVGANISKADGPATYFYQSLKKTEFTIRFCQSDGKAFDLKKS